MSQFEIEYEPRTLVKGQAIADFKQEGTKSMEIRAWTLHIDGSSASEKSGAGVILTNPNGDEAEFAINLGFKASNNEAEYEALVHGLEIADKMRVKKLVVYSDSQLVVQEMLGQYNVKDDRMIRYVEKATKIMQRIQIMHH